MEHPELFTSLADLPSVDGIPDERSDQDKPPRSTIQVAKVGKFKHPRYGNFDITPAVFEMFIRNLAEVSGGEVAIDTDHEPERGGSTKAYGWIKALRSAGNELLADVEWTWEGAMLVADRTYRYISPTWAMAYTSDDDTKRGPTLLGAALTNRPFFERMRPCVLLSQTFSRDELQFAKPDAPEPDECPTEGCKKPKGHQGDHTKIAERPPSDSRPAMETKTFAKALGLEEDATEDQILEAARAAADAAEQAPSEDQVVVTASKLAELEQGASKADSAEKAADKANGLLANMRFSAAYDAAVEKVALDTTDETKDRLRSWFDNDEDQCLAHIASLHPIANAEAAGHSTNPGEDGDVPAGHDPESYRLDQKVQAYRREHNLDYPTALARVMEDVE